MEDDSWFCALPSIGIQMKRIDEEFLPWAIETLEEQHLLSSLCEVVYVGKMTYYILLLGSNSAQFIVWTSNPHYGAGSDSEEGDSDDIEPVDSDHEPDIEDDVPALPLSTEALSPDSRRRKENEDA